jgi:hypothetical protein
MPARCFPPSKKRARVLGNRIWTKNKFVIVILRSEATKNLAMLIKGEILRSLRSLRMTDSRGVKLNAIALTRA